MCKLLFVLTGNTFFYGRLFLCVSFVIFSDNVIFLVLNLSHFPGFGSSQPSILPWATFLVLIANFSLFLLETPRCLVLTTRFFCRVSFGYLSLVKNILVCGLFLSKVVCVLLDLNRKRMSLYLWQRNILVNVKFQVL